MVLQDWKIIKFHQSNDRGSTNVQLMQLIEESRYCKHKNGLVELYEEGADIRLAKLKMPRGDAAWHRGYAASLTASLLA